jgi:integrase
VHITESTLAKIKPATDAPQDAYWETGPGALVGFGIVVGRTGKISFRVRGRDADGKRVKRSIGNYPEMSVKDARAAAKVKLGEITGSRVEPVRAASSGPTLQDALDFHIEKMEAGENKRHKACSPRSVRTLRGGIELHFKDWLEKPLVDLDADAIDAVLKHVMKTTERVAGSNEKNKPGRGLANRLLSNISVVWNSYDKRHGLPVPNPCRRLSQGALLARDTRVLNDDMPGWYATVTAMENRVRADLQLFSMFCGVRTDGVRHLKWDDVDYDQNLLFVRQSKGDKPYVVPMTKTLREVLERREADDQATRDTNDHCKPWVFVSPDSEEGCVAEVKEREIIKDEFGDVVERKSLLPGVHVNRRTYLSIAAEAGISQADREALANHEGKGVNAKHYTRPDNWDHLMAIAERIEAAIWQRIRGEKKSTKRGRLRVVK